MTNQEWLQQNNAKIEEIKETLAKKVIMIQTGTNTVEIEFPEVFTTAKNFYWYQVNSDTLLLSADVNGVGIWSYHIKSKTLKQCWTSDYWLNYYQITDDLVLITSSQSRKSTLVYDVKTDTVSATEMNFTGTINIQKVSDYKFLISSSNSSEDGLYSFDTNTKTIKKIRAAGYDYKYFTKVGSSWLVASPYTLGIYRYNVLDDTADTIYSDERWSNFSVIGNECFITSSRSNTGILKYNDDDKTIKPIYDVGSSWRYITKVGDKIFVSSSSSSYPGLYTIENDEVINIYETGYGYQYFHTINDRVVISNKSSKLLLIYDFINKSIEKIDTLNGNSFAYGVAIGNKLLLTTSTTNYTKLNIYHYDTNTVSENASTFKFTNYDTFRLDGENCYLSSSEPEKVMILYYTNADDSVTLAGAKLGVKL